MTVQLRSDNTVISKPVRQHRNLKTRHSRTGGNPDPRRGGNLSEMTETPEILDSHFRGNDGSVSFRQHRNLETRHFRAGGNLDLRRGGNLSEMTETPRSRFPLPWE